MSPMKDIHNIFLKWKKVGLMPEAYFINWIPLLTSKSRFTLTKVVRIQWVWQETSSMYALMIFTRRRRHWHHVNTWITFTEFSTVTLWTRTRVAILLIQTNSTILTQIRSTIIRSVSAIDTAVTFLANTRIRVSVINAFPIILARVIKLCTLRHLSTTIRTGITRFTDASRVVTKLTTSGIIFATILCAIGEFILTVFTGCVVRTSTGELVVRLHVTCATVLTWTTWARIDKYFFTVFAVSSFGTHAFIAVVGIVRLTMGVILARVLIAWATFVHNGAVNCIATFKDSIGCW